jgi:hypothetical protein
MVSAKAENVHYTDHTVPAAQVLFTQTRPFRRVVLFYEEAEAVAPDELRRAQDELKVIFDAPRREETANALAEQIREETKRWAERAERVVLQLRPAGCPIPETLQRSQDLHFRVTRFANPSKVVKAFLENLEEVRTWHAEAQALYRFVVLDKRLPIFQRARRLLEEIERAEGVPGIEPLMEEDARRRRGRLAELAASGRAAHEWEDFTAALVPLQERFREVYTALHGQRDEATAQARERLQAAGVPVKSNLLPYECRGLEWDEDGLHCAYCRASLKELPLQAAALPSLVRELRERYAASADYGEEVPRVRRLRVTEVVPKPRIENEAELEEALDTLRGAVTEALGEVDAVELE